MVCGQLTRLTNRLRALPATVPYASLGRKATPQLQAGRGILFPTLRATAYHAYLQLRDSASAARSDRREHDKLLRVLLNTPARYVRDPAGDWLVLSQPHLSRYAAACALLVARANLNPPHAPGRPDPILRFALENER